MKIQVGIICIISAFLFQCSSCDETPKGPSINRWTCSCASIQERNQTNAVTTNCSTSCDCRPEACNGGSTGDRWTCNCAAEGFTRVDSIHDSGCFTSCNCTSSSLSDPNSSKKHISNKLVVYILLLSVVLTALAFLGSVGCYIYRKDKSHDQSPIFSSDRDTSCNSASNLISHTSISVLEGTANMKFPFNPLTGCLKKASFTFRGKRGIIPGSLIQFTYFELELATNKFSSSNIIGLGGSSHVYHGQLKDGRTVAIKRLKTQGGPEADSIFLTEIELISRLHHCHVVPLLGYCSESQGKHAERLLIFEYISNGNLRDCLDGIPGKEPIDWGTRVSIALGAARGLEYLHEAAAPRILHRDVKSTNILLDHKWRAKITDLGMAKSLQTDDLPSCSNSPARMQGTFGYFAPECAIIGRASLKSDVFSFGVVLLELITGRQPIQKSPNKGEESLVIWATPRLQDSKRVISELPDPLLKGDFPDEEMQIMAYLAKECLLLDPDSRPTMSEVVQVLSTIAPEKSKRRNFSVNLFQEAEIYSENGLIIEYFSTVEITKVLKFLQVKNMKSMLSSPSDSIRSIADTDRFEEHEVPVDVEEIKQSKPGKWSARCSLPLNVDRTLCDEDGIKEGDAALSSKYIERLILSISKARSWRASDDESVDITEPRFESFWQANMHSL